ncbi:MAG TPA: recombinase family protein [bacterium]|nr:recombinase family protein [bacterium]
MLVGYARVSTAEQNLDLQKDALKKVGCERIYQDVASGARTDRPQLAKALDMMRKGDVLVVWKLDRLGRSLKHLIETMSLLEERKVGFKSLQESIDTTTAGGKLIFHIFSSLAEFERALISERTRAGLDSARARGRLGGRPAKLSQSDVRKINAMLGDKSIAITDICKTFGISRPSFYNYFPGGKPHTK